jgi:Fe-S cluster assembly scaffold protein SufB
VFDSVSVVTTFQEELAKAGVLFMPISEALQKHPELVKKYLGTVVPISDNFFATLNSVVEGKCNSSWPLAGGQQEWDGLIRKFL